MSRNRIYSALSTMFLVMLTGLAASAQDHELQGMALFEPSDERPYDNWAQPKSGFFFTFDGIYWHISAPKKTSIGDPTLTPTVYYGPTDADSITEFNTMDTGGLRAAWKQGDRIELGYVDGHHGWMISTFELNGQTERLGGNNVFTVFNDPPFGPAGQTYLDGVVGTITDPITGVITNVVQELPVNFTQVSVTNRTKINDVEALYLYRPSQLHHGGSLEFMLGARYLSVDDDFLVQATGGNLANSSWNTDAKNYIVGPEIGVRFNQPMGRFALSSEARLMTGANIQQIRQVGILGSNLTAPNAVGFPTLMNATGFQNAANYTEFAPLAELRTEAHYDLTRIISFQVGFTALWVNNVARGSEMVDYTLPSLGITTANRGNRDSLYLYGLNIGVSINR